ncbi:Multi-sensor signal transduction multi-kinase [Sinorhizobium medicae]|uniref:histidine kinase n=1 Tax=Sinorhizobium medicae TaxID=110321 RepID=A0A508X6J0_9HYPH|nr:Multi-sensor signal transduction multi-kinase [Sinorhizobium medicae]
MEWDSRSAARRWVRDVCAEINQLRYIGEVDRQAIAAIAQHPDIISVDILAPRETDEGSGNQCIPRDLITAFELELGRADGGLAVAATRLSGENCAYCISIGSHSRDGLLYATVATARVSPILMAVSATIATSVALNRSRLRSQQRLRDLWQSTHDISQRITKLKTDIAVSREIGKSGTLRWDISGDGAAEWSDEVYQVFGFDKERDRPAFELILSRIHPDDLADVRHKLDEAALANAVCHLRYRIVRRDGSLRHLLSVFRPEGAGSRMWTGIFIDLTDRHETGAAVGSAHSSLTTMSRLMTVGQLGASIAHELNQPLTSMVANAGATLRWAEKSPLEQARVLTGLNAIVAEAKRASGVVKGLRALARKSEPRFELIDPDDAIAEVLPLIANEMASQGIKIRSQLGGAGATVNADRVQLQQMVLALVLNAWSAPIDDRGERVIVISTTGEVDRIALNVRYHGLWVKNELVDRQTRSELSADVTASGVGISVFRSIVEAHGASFEVRTIPRDYAEVEVALPVHWETTDLGMRIA